MRRLDARGLGMLELLLALALGAAVVVLVLPSFARYQQVRDLRHAARQLLADVRLAQQHAQTLDANVRLVYAPGPPSRYTLEKADGSPLKQTEVPATVTVSGSYIATPLEFRPSGAPAAAGEFCLTEGTQILRLDVAAGTGRAQLSEVTSCP
ncbi:MAG: GspH/FimT family protein [Armatimonadota bacterium]|nr:GspH/FimT family protein [Armatimonadota bacterium]MDR7451941.1 GspH/FimT family protein [Armatimonadota bacterium]MDR7466623.1 GspH/FimT family protein [Armatimonadota bacterium]MDR7492903.1 GspH/FimT family protein [Armatimonadota bacterium]MDR7500430.1 GspH/FimT family protein [Armatimonadota bacterium]